MPSDKIPGGKMLNGKMTTQKNESSPGKEKIENSGNKNYHKSLLLKLRSPLTSMYQSSGTLEVTKKINDARLKN